MTLRDLASKLIQDTEGGLDDNVKVRIVERDQNGVVIKHALAPISRLSHFNGDVCCSTLINIENSEIKWEWSK